MAASGSVRQDLGYGRENLKEINMMVSMSHDYIKEIAESKKLTETSCKNTSNE